MPRVCSVLTHLPWSFARKAARKSIGIHVRPNQKYESVYFT